MKCLIIRLKLQTIFLFSLLVCFIFILPNMNWGLTISTTNAAESNVSGTYNLTPVTEFSSDFSISVSGLAESNYFAIYRNDTIIGSVVPIADKVRSIPQMFSDPAILEIRFYNDSTGSYLMAAATLTSSQALLFKPLDHCFIATAAFGSKYESSVVILRQFRDKYLLSNSLGQIFVGSYYYYSPPIAKLVAGNSFLKIFVRICLIPLIALAYLILHPLWILIIITFGLIGWFMVMRIRKNRSVWIILLILVISIFFPNVPTSNAATVKDVEDNSLRIGYNLYSLNSDSLTDQNISLSLTELNQVYFKIGGRWYDIMAAENDAEIGDPVYAIHAASEEGWTGLDTWYKAGSEYTTLINLPDLPPAPSGLTATPASSSQINLSWTSVSGAESYNVYRASAQTGSYIKITNSFTNSFSDSGLSANTTYWYKVSSVYGADEGFFSLLISATTAMNPPVAPSGLTATPASSSQINLSWTSVAGASSYNVYRASAQAGSYSKITNCATNSFNDSGLSAYTTYWYKVAAVNSAGEGSFSSLTSTTTAMNLPAAPSGLTATPASSSQINLSWTSVTGASSYNVYRSSAQAGPYSKMTNCIVNSCSDSGLAANTTYWYKVSAVNSAGEGNLSSSVSTATFASLDTYLSNASTFYDNKQYNEAIAECNKAVLITSSNADIYLIRGLSYLWLNQLTNAWSDFSTTLQLDPNRAKAYSGKGYYYLYNDQFDDAITQFNTSIQLDSTIEINYVGRGFCYAQLGQPQSALQDFNSLILQAPNDADGYFLRAATYFELDNDQACIADYTQVIELDPQNETAYNNRGAAYDRMGQSQDAINDYLKATQLDPTYYFAFNNLGVVYYYLGQDQNAVNAFSQAISIEPQYALAYSNRGEAYASLGQNSAALSSWAQAIAINAELEAAYSARGWYYVNSDQYSLAVNDFTHAIQFSSDTNDDSFDPWRSVHYRIGSGRPGAFNGRGWSYYFLQQYSFAISDFSSCLSINPNYANAYDGRGWCYYQLDQYNNAVTDFTKCISLNPTEDDAFHGRGCCYYWLKKYSNAVTDFTTCISLNPANDSNYSWRGWCYIGLKWYNYAQADFNRCLAINPNNQDAIDGLAWLQNSSYSAQSVDSIPIQDPGSATMTGPSDTNYVPIPKALINSLPVVNDP